MAPELRLLMAGAAVAGFVQGLSGFTFGMVAMSFCVWGIEPVPHLNPGLFKLVPGSVLRGLREL